MLGQRDLPEGETVIESATLCLGSRGDETVASSYSTSNSNVERTSWHLTDVASGDELDIAIQLSPCDELEPLTVTESGTSVRIDAKIRKEVRSACANILLSERRTVSLDSPLGERTLRGCNPGSAVYQRANLSDDDCASVVTR